MKSTNLEYMQNELKYAFKWMARATDLAKQGEFSGATYAMTVAQQHWNNCQHCQDKYINDDDAKQIHWDFFATKAMAMAKEELAKEKKGK